MGANGGEARLPRELTERLEPLREAVERRRVVPVVGSGLSQGLPSWSLLLQGLVSELGDAERPEVEALLEQEKYLEVASELEHSSAVGRARVASRVQQFYQRPRRERPPVYDELAQLPAPAFVTTNYDPWLKDAVATQHRQAPWFP